MGTQTERVFYDLVAGTERLDESGVALGPGLPGTVPVQATTAVLSAPTVVTLECLGNFVDTLFVNAALTAEAVDVVNP